MALPTRQSGRGEMMPGRSFWEPIGSLRREMERLFEDFSRDLGWEPSAFTGRGMAPRIDVKETEGELKIEAELPGVDEKDVEVLLDDGRLTVRGEKKQEREDKKENYYLHERTYGSFARSIPLPFEADPDQVKATYDKGVLKISIPKPPEAKAKQRKIQIAKA